MLHWLNYALRFDRARSTPTELVSPGVFISRNSCLKWIANNLFVTNGCELPKKLNGFKGSEIKSNYVLPFLEVLIFLLFFFFFIFFFNYFDFKFECFLVCLPKFAFVCFLFCSVCRRTDLTQLCLYVKVCVCVCVCVKSQRQPTHPPTHPPNENVFIVCFLKQSISTFVSVYLKCVGFECVFFSLKNEHFKHKMHACIRTIGILFGIILKRIV